MPFIYKISSPHTDKVYIGSTTRDLRARFSQHKRYDNGTTSKEIIAYGEAIIECLEEVDNDVMKERERFYIELMREKCVNQVIPLRTKKEWHLAHKKEENERTKKWCEQHKDYMKNIDVIRSVINKCECGGRFSLKSKSSHFKTKRHIKHLGKLK